MVPLKNSTLLMVAPEAGVAVAASAMVAGGEKVALFAGEVRVTVGGGGGVTVTLMTEEVLVAPLLSVALAVSE